MGQSSKDFLEQRESEATDLIKPVLTLNKASLNTQIQSIVQSVESGNANPLEAFIYLNFMQKVADGARKKLLEQAIIEAEKYSEKETKVYDATVMVKNGAGKYDYSGIKEIEEKEAELKVLKEKAKAAFAATQSGNIITDKETGEIIMPAKYNPSGQIIAIKFN